jgi:hypothetical protein
MPTTATDKPLDLLRPGFRDWLAVQPPESRVGLTKMSDRCPIASYLNSSTTDPHEVISVGEGAYVVWNHYAPDATERDLPPWAEAFVALVDATTNGQAFDTFGHLIITAKQALELLDTIPEDA